MKKRQLEDLFLVGSLLFGNCSIFIFLVTVLKWPPIASGLNCIAFFLARGSVSTDKGSFYHLK